MKRLITLLLFTQAICIPTLFGQTYSEYQKQEIYLTGGTTPSYNLVTDFVYFPNDSATVIIEWNECNWNLYSNDHLVIELNESGYITVGDLDGRNIPFNCTKTDTFKISPQEIIWALEYSMAVHHDKALRFRFKMLGGNPCNCTDPNYISRFSITIPTMEPCFFADKREICEGISVQFSDTTSGNLSERIWRFPGGVPEYSTLQNPVITYPNFGYYAVTLITTNAFATDSIVQPAYIKVNQGGAIDAGPDLSVCYGDSIQLNATASSASYVWIADSAILDPFSLTTFVKPAATSEYVLWSGGQFTCSNYDTVVVTVISPEKPVITSNGIALQSSPASTYQWYLNGNAINGATGQSFSPEANGNYTVEITEGDCPAVADPYYYSTVPATEVNDLNTDIQINNLNQTLVLASREGISAVSVYTIFGSKVHVQQYSDFTKSATINTASFSQGIYFLSIADNNNKLITRKIILQ